MTKLQKGIQFIQKIGDGIYNFIDNYNNDTLYLFDYEDVKEEYIKVKMLYKNNPSLFDLRDFANNYAFSFYQQKNLLDHQKDAELMSDQVVAYIQSIENSGLK